MDKIFQTLNGPAWKKIGVKPHHGIALPLFSLHSAKSCGIGEFYDLLPLILWCQTIGYDTIQLLPLNALDGDFSPYNGISSCALSELYLSLHALPHVEESNALQEQLTSLRALSKTERIHYQEITSHKLQFLRAYLSIYGEKLWEKKATQAFIAKNPWVKSYALFKVLKEQSSNAPIHSWAPHLQAFHPKEQEKLLKLYPQEVRFHLLIQYLCYSQLLFVKEHALKHGIHLMGDIPILLSRESADIWCYPHSFDLNFAAGAPPDAYNSEGQYWGFPIPRVDVLRKHHFHWWKQRLKYASHFYDLFRIDHVIGLFRLWSIPLEHPSKEGFYIPHEEALWGPQGKELLTMISHAARPMLPIAEDLGTVPDMLREVLLEMGICGTKVMRWEKDWGKTEKFTPLQDYPPLSVTTLGTHDSTTLSLWWKEEEKEARQLCSEKGWTYTPEISFEQRKEILKDSHKTKSLFHINPLQEYLALFPELISEDPTQERINIPGKMLETNWTYRFRLSIEEMIEHLPLKQAMREIIS